MFPDEGLLFGIKERSDIGCPFRFGVQHTFGVLAGEVLDDRCKGLGTNLAPKPAQVAVGL